MGVILAVSIYDCERKERFPVFRSWNSRPGLEVLQPETGQQAPGDGMTASVQSPRPLVPYSPFPIPAFAPPATRTIRSSNPSTIEPGSSLRPVCTGDTWMKIGRAHV